MNIKNTLTSFDSPLTLQVVQVQPNWTVRQSDIGSLVEGFDPISLQGMEGAALLNRMDTKFVLTLDQVRTALEALQPDYCTLCINGQRMNHYRTLYFDTPGFALYHDHVNGRAERYKVRSREYTDTHLSYLEVKHKTRKNRTVKERIPTAGQVVTMTPEMAGWLKDVTPLDAGSLVPKLWNTFTRVTLVSKVVPERVTLDFDLVFYSENETAGMDGLVVAEVKHDANRDSSPFLRQMRDQKILPHSFSKYTIGVALLYEGVKKNTVKSKIHWLEKLTQRTAGNERYF